MKNFLRFFIIDNGLWFFRHFVLFPIPIPAIYIITSFMIGHILYNTIELIIIDFSEISHNHEPV